MKMSSEEFKSFLRESRVAGTVMDLNYESKNGLCNFSSRINSIMIINDKIALGNENCSFVLHAEQFEDVEIKKLNGGVKLSTEIETVEILVL